MGDYEAEQQKLLNLWEYADTLDSNTEREEPFIDTDSDVEETDHMSERSEASDTEQEISDDELPDEEIAGNTGARYIWGADKKTKWAETPPNPNVRTRQENIIIHLPGTKNAAKLVKSPKECWELFIDNDIIDCIVMWTNQLIDVKSANYTKKSQVGSTTPAEIKALIGLLYMAGRMKGGRLNLEDLWADDGTGIDIFRATMPLGRFYFLLCCLRFDNRENRNERSLLDKLAPIRSFLDKFVENCQQYYIPSEYLPIDEKLERFRGKCGFRHFIPNKPAKYGLKVFALVDSKTFYVLNLEVYVGVQPEGPYSVSNKPMDIVCRLVTPIAGSRRNITFDNWFTSYELLIKLLKDYKLTSVGTVRKNKRQIPNEILIVKNRPEKTSKFVFQTDVTLVSYVPKKNKNVLIMSTLHHDNNIDPSTGELNKLELITFYNMTKGGVDTVDQLSATYDVSRNSRRWPLTLFFSFLNTAGINAFVLYLNNNEEKNKRRYFIKELSLALVKQHHMNRFPKPKVRLIVRRKISDMTHEPIPCRSEADEKRQRTSSRCHICPRKKDRKTHYVCTRCKCYICLKHAAQICVQCKNLDSQESD